ncbi:hypothetical protein, partial [Tychonema sp. LEGE 07199]|uniref:hypothetical protein n=1 Tax=Tychonema sp. LEGE 07199 TaxID=1828668 RepID=UPI001D144079
ETGFLSVFLVTKPKNSKNTRFLAMSVNLRNGISLGISRHQTQKLKDVKWVLYEIAIALIT